MLCPGDAGVDDLKVIRSLWSLVVDGLIFVRNYDVCDRMT